MRLKKIQESESLKTDKRDPKCIMGGREKQTKTIKEKKKSESIIQEKSLKLKRKS